MINNKFKFSIALSVFALTNSAFAGGLSLPQIGTAESLATAGVSNVTNNRDASAVITNPAGLSGVEDSSTVLGLQYVNVESNFILDSDGTESDSSADLFMPHLSYAKRINEQWVAGIALHSPGGLGLEYDNGLAGNSIIDSSTVTMLNINASVSYQVNDRLAVGGSLIAQYGGLNTELSSLISVKSSDWSPSFSLSGLYQATESTHIGLIYNYGATHNLKLEASSIDLGIDQELNWPQSVEVGIYHQLTTNVTVMANANWQDWSNFGEHYEDTFGGGIAMSYQLDRWKLHTGFSADSSPIDSDNRTQALILDKQWRLGLGAERVLDNGMRLGLAYQYQSLGDGEINNSPLGNGEYDNNRLHFITASLSF